MTCLSEIIEDVKRPGKMDVIRWAEAQPLRGRSKAVLMQLATFWKGGVCRPSHRALATRLGVSTRTIERAVMDLIEVGIERRYRYGESGRRVSNDYLLPVGKPLSQPRVTNRQFDGKTNRQSVGRVGSSLTDNLSITNRQFVGERFTEPKVKPKEKKIGSNQETAVANLTERVRDEKNEGASRPKIDFDRQATLASLAEILNPSKPDAVMAEKYIDHLGSVHPRPTVKNAVARLKARVLSGEKFTKPGIILGRICEDITAENNRPIPFGAIVLSDGTVISRY